MSIALKQYLLARRLHGAGAPALAQEHFSRALQGELPEALEIARVAGVRLVGLHMYAGTNNLSLSRFLTCFDRLLAAAESLPDLEEVDVGGGFGVAYREDPDRVAPPSARISSVPRLPPHSIRVHQCRSGCGFASHAGR